jgi:hypothetical protein
MASFDYALSLEFSEKTSHFPENVPQAASRLKEGGFYG